MEAQEYTQRTVLRLAEAAGANGGRSKGAAVAAGGAGAALHVKDHPHTPSTTSPMRSTIAVQAHSRCFRLL